MRRLFRRLTTRGSFGITLAAFAVGGLLAGCGSAAASPNASATATCPPAPRLATVTGTITATASGSITVTTSGGTATQVSVSSSTRITDVVLLQPSDLTVGTSVLVVTDTAATTAQRIQIVSGSAGEGGFGGRASGTPPAGVNASCFRRQGQEQQGQGTDRTRGGGGFSGLRGTVDSATATNLTFDDTTGQTYSVSITPTTVIAKMATGQVSDLKNGASVMVTGTSGSSGTITARSITVQLAAKA